MRELTIEDSDYIHVTLSNRSTLMKSVHQKLQSALHNQQQVHVTFSDGTTLPNCTVAEVEGTTFTLISEDGHREIVRRSQLAHVHVISK